MKSESINSDHQIVVTNTNFENIPQSIEEHFEIVIVDFQCDGADDVLMNANEKLMNYIWIIMDTLSSDEVAGDIWPIFQNISILPKSEIFYLSKESAANGWMVHQVYKTGLETPLIVERFGEITEQWQFIDYRRTTIASRRRQNLLGLRLKASMVVTHNDTLDHLTDYQLRKIAQNQFK